MPEFGPQHHEDEGGHRQHEHQHHEDERSHREDERRKRQDELDEAGEESFPASDPPATGRPDPPPLPGPH